MPALTDEQKRQVYAYLEGTCHGPDAAIDRFALDCDTDDVVDAMLDLNLEQCPVCDWWMESGELVNDDLEVVGCQQCRAE